MNMLMKVKIRQNSCYLILIAILLGLFHENPASGQEVSNPENRLAEKIHDTLKELHAIRMERQVLNEQQKLKIAEVNGQIKRIENDIEKTTTDLLGEKTIEDKMLSEIDKNMEFKEATENLLSGSVERSLPVAIRIKERLDVGIPYRKRERQDKTNRIITGLEQSHLKDRAEAVLDCLSFIYEELRLADSISLWNEPVLLDEGKRSLHAYQIRMGLVEQYFISEDGQVAGIAAKKPGQDWILQPDLVPREQIKLLLDTLQERRPPDVIPVPFSIKEGSTFPIQEKELGNQISVQSKTGS